MSARRGWIADPPPPPPREYTPGEEHKWRRMHGFFADGTPFFGSDAHKALTRRLKEMRSGGSG